MESTEPKAGRADVERYWLDVIAGRRSVRDASAWAEDHLTWSYDAEELVLQGLLFLQHQQFSPASDDQRIAHMEKVLELWRLELQRFDLDPQGWERARLRRLLTGFMQSRGIDKAQAFGRRMVRAGVLRECDIDEALGSPAATEPPGLPSADCNSSVNGAIDSRAD